MTADAAADVNALLAALDVYRPARQTLLAALGLPESNRDPLAEFSEHLVAALLDGTLAVSRVQAGHDLVLVDGDKVQVRYLANPANTWINEHVVCQIPGVRQYALVIFEALVVTGVVVFPLDRLQRICAALRKRHPLQEEQLQLTRRNWLAIRDASDPYRQLGVQALVPDTSANSFGGALTPGQ